MVFGEIPASPQRKRGGEFRNQLFLRVAFAAEDGRIVQAESSEP